MDNQYLQKALEYATDRGWPVFPCKPDKTPLTEHGFKDATTDREQIGQWWSQHPEALIGHPTGNGHFVVDLDRKNGVDGWATFTGLGAAPDTLTAVTQNNGLHLFFKTPEGITVNSTAGQLGPGVDVRGDGGYVILAGSKGYEWEASTTVDMADPPEWLIEKVTSKPQAPPQRYNRAKVGPGGRNTHLASLAGSMRNKGIEPGDIETLLLRRNQEECDPPLPDDEVRKIAASVSKYEPGEQDKGPTLEDFYAHMPDHRYIYRPTRELWPVSSVDSRLEWPMDDNGKPIKPSRWLDKNRPVEQMIWSPGELELIKDQHIDQGGWVDHQGARVFNLYRAPCEKHGDPNDVAPWLDHIETLYPEEAEHIVQWFAFKVQKPGVKINHALVFGGPQGVGKDTLLEPVKHAVGPWNFQEVSPAQLLGRFNGFIKSVILRTSEARDLGETDRFTFYEHMKQYTASPPDVLRCDEKNIREHSVLNVMGVVITTNHKAGGIHLPADDRRHFVCWTDKTKEDFDESYWNRLWGWYQRGGFDNVAAHLAQYDLAGFDPKAPPRKTDAFWHIVNAARSDEENALADVLDGLKNPDAVTLDQIKEHTRGEDSPHRELHWWLQDRKVKRQIPHRMEEVGYEPVRNPRAKDQLWKINGKRQVIYVRKELNQGGRLNAANNLVNGRTILF